MGSLRKLCLLAGFASSFACIDAAWADPAPPPDETRRERAAIGDLTLNYDPLSWRIARDGDALTATCLQSDCLGAVIDVSRHEGEEGCTREKMALAVEAAFPQPGRAYANTLRAGRLALILANRHDGPDLSSPLFVYGCVAWQGSEYRFAMRPETVGTQSWIGGALHHLVSQATASAVRVEQIRVGRLTVPISTEVWAISKLEGNDTALLTCRMPTCHEQGQIAVLSAHEPSRPCRSIVGSQEVLPREWNEVGVLTAAEPGGLDFTVWNAFLGCRNYVPPRFEACTVHDGRSYHLSTFGPAGCRSSSSTIPESNLLELLRGARIAD